MADHNDNAILFEKAVALQNRGAFTEALAIWELLVRHAPPFAEVFQNHAVVLTALGRDAEALVSYDHASTLKPSDVALHFAKALSQQRIGLLEAAISSYDRVLQLEPTNAAAHYGKGTALQRLDRLEEALGSYDQAIHLDPKHAMAHNNRGTVLLRLGMPEEALRSYDLFEKLAPGIPEGQLNKASCNLLMGQFETGWPQYEARKTFITPAVNLIAGRSIWSGDIPLDGKTLLLHAEQGLGDTIQFCRYAALAVERGATVILSAPGKIKRLLESFARRIDVVDNGRAPPPCDFQSMLLSMPLAFRTTEKTIPSFVPYLRGEPDRVRVWRDRIGQQGFRVGIAWQGDPQSAMDLGRSFPLSLFKRISQIEGVRLISLQKFDGAEQLLDLPPGLSVENLSDELDPGPDAFLDSAAIIENLDLVISSDSAIAHLAGALGRPVWVALQHVSDWRWMLERSDSPWYPTMRLFRQPHKGDWHSVFEDIAAALHSELPQPPLP